MMQRKKKHLVLVMVGRALALSLLTQLCDVFDDLLLRGSPHQFARLHNNTMPQNRITEKGNFINLKHEIALDAFSVFTGQAAQFVKFDLISVPVRGN